MNNDSRENGGVNSSLDDSYINSQYGEDDTGQEDQSQLIHIFDPYIHHQCHEAQHDGAVHSHVVQECYLCLWPIKALNFEDGCLGNDVNLKKKKEN